ncbi:MAG: sigma 54-interacting transcriptional regulator [Planctomycetota bacterium]|nr:sigma 54-interacting transcriptional regulator [Planctomycetota bacterium]
MPHFVITGPSISSRNWSFPDVDVFIIGRSSTCALILADSKRKVSQIHAAIVRFSQSEGQYFIRDLGSRDSIKVAGENVYQRILGEGDRIEIGDYRLLFRREATSRAALPRLRIVPSKDLQVGIGGETIYRRDISANSRADAAGKELIEQCMRLSDRGVSMTSLFREFMPRILNYLDADRGFIARFISSEAREFEEVAAFCLGSDEQIEITDEACFDRLLLTEIVHDHTTLLIPIASAQGVRGFFCVDRRTARIQTFPPAHVSFALKIGELAAQCCEPFASSSVAVPSCADDVRAWPAGLIGTSKALKNLQKDIARAAKTKGNVLIIGETGSGKELVADALHLLGCGESATQIKRDCAAIPESLADTELFGNEKGAFTDSKTKTKGLFELAHGGSIFLDEIQELPTAVSHKLYRVLLDKKVWRVRAPLAISVDVFVIAAIMSKPNNAEAEGVFERAFLERFAEKIYVPALRERREDIPLLVFQFIDACASTGSRTRSVSHSALELLMKYDWPGNVRELKNFIENVVKQGTEIILSSDLPPTITGFAHSDQTPSSRNGDTSREEALRTLAEIEREAIQVTLTKTGGNIAKTARILDIAEMSVRNKMKAFNISGGYGRSQK